MKSRVRSYCSQKSPREMNLSVSSMLVLEHPPLPYHLHIRLACFVPGQELLPERGQQKRKQRTEK